MKKEMNLSALQANLRMIEKRGEISLEQAKNSGDGDRWEKIGRLLSQESFSADLLAVNSAEEAQALFAQNGVVMTLDEVNAIGRQIGGLTGALIKSGGELSEEDLEKVAGGISIAEMIAGGSAIGTAGIGAGVGTMIFPGVGTCIGLVVGAVGGLAFGVGGTKQGWFEKAESGLRAGAMILSNAVTSTLRQIGDWITGWF